MNTKFLLGACAALAVSAPAHAGFGDEVVLFDLATPTGETASPGMHSYVFDAGAGLGLLNFTLQGYRTLDGEMPTYQDTLTVSLNGNVIFSGTFDLGPGGGGNNVVYDNSMGGQLDYTYQTDALRVSEGMIDLINGSNTLTFQYTGLAQGIGDEAWGLNEVHVIGPAGGAVPEPAAWAMMIAGFGVVGAALRGSRRQRAALTYA